MKIVNVCILAFLIGASACSSSSVPESDKAAQAFARGDVAAAAIHIKNALENQPNDPKLLDLGGRIALNEDSHDLAKARFAALLAVAPDYPDVRTHLARAELMTSGGAAALKALGSEPARSAETIAVLVAANLQLNKPEQAFVVLDKGLAAFPDSPDLLAMRGERSLAEGDMAAAREAAGRALRVAPGNAEALLLSAHVALTERHPDEAARQFASVLRARPNNIAALIGRAAILSGQGKKDEAEQLFAKAAALPDSRNRIARFFLADMAFRAGDIQRANTILTPLSDFEAYPPAMALAGLVAMRRGSSELGISLLSRYLADGNDDVRVRYALADALARVGDTAGAWSVLRPAAEAANANMAVLRLAATLTQKLKEPAAAIYRARFDGRKAGDPIGSQMKAADAAISANNWKKADAIYASLLAKDPQSQNIILLNNAALARLELGDRAQALAFARRAASIAPNDPLVADTLGWILFQMSGRTAEVVALMRRAAEGQPNNAEIQRHVMAVARRSDASPAGN